jgi:hypothetical protein
MASEGRSHSIQLYHMKQNKTLELLTRLQPFVNQIGFLDAKFDDVVASCGKWFFERGGSRPAPFDGDIYAAVQFLNPRNSRRLLVNETESKWTAFFVDRCDAPLSETAYVSNHLQCAAVIAGFHAHTYDPDTNLGEMGGVQLSVLEPHPTRLLNYRRSISLTNNGNTWEFEDYGEPFSFENQELYRARCTEDRFDVLLLHDYLKHLGIDAYNPNFYGKRWSLFKSAP